MAETTDGLDLVARFLNTLDRRTFTRLGRAGGGSDALTSPAALAVWLAAEGLITGGSGPDGPGGDGSAPRTPGAAHGSVTSDDLATAVALREALRTALEDPAAAGPLLAGFPLRLAPDAEGRLRLGARTGVAGLDAVVEAVATSTASGRWHRLRLCASPDCRWAFHDTSRSGGGRWCSMEVCGNRHKTRAYRERRAG